MLPSHRHKKLMNMFAVNKQGQTLCNKKQEAGRHLISYNWEIIMNDLKYSNVMASNKIKRSIVLKFVNARNVCFCSNEKLYDHNFFKIYLM